MSADSPYAAALGIRALPDAPGRLALPPAAETLGRPGFLHGGAIAGLLEAAAYAALDAALAADGDGAAQVKPITVTIDYLRGGRQVETWADATVTRLGARIANVVAEAWQDDRARPIASARLTLRVRRGSAAG